MEAGPVVGIVILAIILCVALYYYYVIVKIPGQYVTPLDSRVVIVSKTLNEANVNVRDSQGFLVESYGAKPTRNPVDYELYQNDKLVGGLMFGVSGATMVLLKNGGTVINLTRQTTGN